MLIRHPDGRWSFDRRHALHALGLFGTGALRPVRLGGLVRIARGGVFLHVRRRVHRDRDLGA
jgi:hypothetical protein